MKLRLILFIALLFVLSLPGCFNGSNDSDSSEDIIVNSLEDATNAAPGVVTLRMALAAAEDGQAIVFDESLDGGTILLLHKKLVLKMNSNSYLKKKPSTNSITFNMF